MGWGFAWKMGLIRFVKTSSRRCKEGSPNSPKISSGLFSYLRCWQLNAFLPDDKALISTEVHSPSPWNPAKV